MRSRQAERTLDLLGQLADLTELIRQHRSAKLNSTIPRDWPEYQRFSDEVDFKLWAVLDDDLAA